MRESREFRLLYGGQFVTATGWQLTAVAAPIQVFALTKSSFAVGLLGLAQLVPLVVGSLVGGAMADAHDRRRLLLLSQSLLGLTSVGLVINAFSSEPRLWAIFVLTSAAAALSGLDHPTRSAATPALVRREILPSALALNQLMWQTCMIVGPALAGLIIAKVSITAAFAFDVATYVIAIAIMMGMQPLVPEGGGTRLSRSSLAEGLRYLKGKQALQGTFIIDINAMVFGMPRALFPELGETLFHGDETTVGLLYAAPAAGAFVGAATSGWISSINRQGRGVIVAVVGWGASILLFGLTSWLPLALLWLALAGAADVVSAVFRNSILQLTVPDRLRGRLSATHIAVVTGGPRLGDAEAGAVAALTTPQISVVSGGVACMLGALAIGALMPKLATWTTSHHAVIDDD